jgi:Mg2+/Co2+ transporter CorB
MTAGATYEFMPGLIASVVVTILIVVVTAIIPNEPAAKH